MDFALITLDYLSDARQVGEVDAVADRAALHSLAVGHRQGSWRRVGMSLVVR